jgi:drug/metabolite transporter (DMT)-like permease
VTPTRRGVTWEVASATAYSIGTLVGKQILSDLRPSDTQFWRFTIAAPLAWVVVWIRARRGGPSPADAPIVRLMALGVIFGFMSMVGFAGLRRLPASVFILLAYSYPAMVAAASPLVGRRVRPATWGAIVLCLFGLSLTVPEVYGSAGSLSMVGAGLVIVSAALYAIYMLVGSKIIRHGVDGPIAIACSASGSLVGMTVYAFVNGLRTPAGSTTARLFVFAAVSTVLAGACFFQAMRTLAPAVVAMVATLEPVLAVGWAVLALHEHLRPIQLVGGALVLVGVLASQGASAEEPSLPMLSSPP